MPGFLIALSLMPPDTEAIVQSSMWTCVCRVCFNFTIIIKDVNKLIEVTFDERKLMKNNGSFFFNKKCMKKKTYDILQPILLLESLRLFLILRFMKENEMKNNFSLLFFTFNIVICLLWYWLHDYVTQIKNR